jgi:ATP-dependent RNA helicase SUPV3L1/SUV3
VLASDGVLRWVGDAVGRLAASEDALRPRVGIIADERLTGASLQAAQARLDLWLKTHIEKLLGPLFELSAGADVTGIARGIAFQVTEALGVLDRHQVAADLKGLDQSNRAVLRKYGMRFGAYHVYFPALLKPAPRSLASLLWSLKQDNIDPVMLADARHLAVSGRTSFPIDKTLARDAYRVLGYRVCGDRAVRVDILERLADLIRPALAWNPGSPQQKPPGAFDGSAFAVTQAMTSLTGAAGEDFASILRALGYRMERRPKPPESPPVASPEPASPEATDGAGAQAPASADAQGIKAEASPPSGDAEGLAAREETAERPESGMQAEQVSVEAEASSPAAAADAVGEADATIAATAEAGAAVGGEPELIEVWRPGRPPEERRAWRAQKHQQERQGRRGDAATEGEGETSGRSRHRHGRDRRPDRPRRDAPSAPVVQAEEGTSASAEASPAETPRRDRPRPHQERGGRDRKSGGGGRGEWRGKGRHGGPPDEGASYRQPRVFASTSERRERPIDPNSPFAKLAALKAQLEASAKDRE